MSSRTRATPHVVLNPLALALGLAFLGCAQAQESPWYIGVSQAFTHDSNLFIARKGDEKSDTVSSTGILGGLDLRFGRQHVYADMTASTNRYKKYDQLDNSSYSLNTGLNWQTVEHLSGSFGLIGRRDLGQLAIPGAPEVKNTESLRQATARVRYGFASRLGVQAGVQERKLDYSFSTERNFEERSANVGLTWGTPGSVLTFGVAGRAAKGDAPLYRALLDPQFPFLGYGPVTPDEYDRNDVDFTAVWTPSALSTVNARISLTRERHTAITRPDFSGVTGGVTWEYKPSDKLKLQTSLERDTGSQTIFSTSLLSNFLPVEANTSRVNTVLGLKAAYELTAKIGLTAAMAYNRGDVSADSGSTVGQSSSKYEFGARYQPTRTISLGCNVAHDSYRSLKHTISGCSAQFVLR